MDETDSPGTEAPPVVHNPSPELRDIETTRVGGEYVLPLVSPEVTENGS